MSEGSRNIKVVSFTTISPPEASSVCQSCGEAVHPEGVCRRCALRLMDVALASTLEDYPRIVADLTEGTAKEGLTCLRRYDHYDVCQTPEGRAFELGRGAMGITYKATDVHLGRSVALKIINPGYLIGKNQRDRFLREARTAARLKHPNIASVHHLGLIEDEQCFYAMEYVEGETLEARVRRAGPLPWTTALEITRQAARALRLAHQHQLVHRDIKPTNLMLTSEGQGAGDEILVKLIDFGLVKTIAAEATLDDALTKRYFAGTPGYASPEQLRGEEIDARSDIYSLGVCLWFMLVGEPPVGLTCVDPQAESAAPAFSLERINKKIPPAVSALLQRMISTDPAARPQTAAEMLSQVEDCLVLPRRRAASKPRHLRVVICTGVLVVAAVTTFLVKSGLMSRNPSEHPPGSVDHSSSEVETRVLYAQAKEHASKFTKEDNLRAIELLAKVVAHAPRFAEAHAALASAYLQNFCRYNGPADRLDAALASAQRAVTLDPDLPAGFTVLGAIRTIQGMHWEALGEYRHALELDPRHLPAMRGFAQLWSTVGQPQRGLPWARAAAEIDPAQINSWNAAADASVDLCADEQAEGFYRRCLEINPKWMSAHCGLLHLHLLRGDFAQARRDSLVAESLDPGLLLPLTLKAQVALFSGEYGEAETLYRRLLAMKREGLVHYYGSITYLSALGFLRRQAGDRPESDALLAEAEKLHLKDSEGPQAIYDLAAIRAVQGKTEEALSLLQQAIASGWMDYRATRFDPRFSDLRGEAAFRRLLDDLSLHVEAMRKESELLCSRPLRIEDYPLLPQGR